MSRLMRRRIGLTLVEVLVAAAIGAVLFGAATAILHMGSRSRSVVASAQALSTAKLIEEQLIVDVRCLVTLTSCPVHFDPQRADRLSFYVHDPARDAGRQIAVRAVRYSLDRPNAFLAREWDAAEHSVGASPLTSIAFSPFLGPVGPMVRIALKVGRSPTDPPGPPVTTTLLLRLPAMRGTVPLEYKMISSFMDQADAPGDQTLPAP